MQKINTWHLSILIVIVSVLSLVLVQKYVLAQWQDPSSPPGSTGPNNIVVNPLTEDLNLAGNKLADTNLTIDGDGADNVVEIKNNKNLCLGGVCRSTWTSDSVWSVSGNNVYRTIGNVGIGLSVPVTPLHIQDASGQLMINGAGFYSTANFNLGTAGTFTISSATNPVGTFIGSTKRLGINHTTPGYVFHVADDDATAILNIENLGIDLWTGARLARDGSEKWFIGMTNSADKLLIRRAGTTNDIAIDTAGKVGIGNDNPAYKVDIYDSSSVNPVLYVKNDANGGVAIKGEAHDTSGSYYSHGVEGVGKYGVYGYTNFVDGVGIYGLDGTSANSHAGYFKGDVAITSGTGSKGFLQINSASGAQSSTDCHSDSERGRMMYDYTNHLLYICDGVSGWRSITTN